MTLAEYFDNCFVGKTVKLFQDLNKSYNSLSLEGEEFICNGVIESVYTHSYHPYNENYERSKLEFSIRTETKLVSIHCFEDTDIQFV